jgi:hypothetical protein
MRKRNLICLAFLTFAASAEFFGARSVAAAPRLLAPHGGAIRAFIVGVDDYSVKRRLHGAVADARDLEASLKELGVPAENMTVLIDQQATRKAFVAAMNRLVRRARARDLIFISFAGHGAQMKEMHKNTKPDHLDEVYVLAKFDETVRTGARERVHGPEIKHWLSKLDKKGAEVLFIADTCHGGGLTRSVDPRQSSFSYRVINIAAVAEDTLQPESVPAEAMLTESAFSHVTFLAAVDRHSKAPEVKIEGQKTPRGALSYSVARALRGAADRSKEGAVTRRELFEYTSQVVLQFAEGRQHPYFEPRRRQGLDDVVFRTRSAQTKPVENPGVTASPVVNVSPPQDVASPPQNVASPQAEPQEDAPRGKALRVAVINGPSVVSFNRPVSVELAVVADRSQADIVWDARSKEALSGGDVVARNVSAEDVPWVADRIAAGRSIAALAEKRPQTIKLLPNDSLHKLNEKLTLEATGLKGKHLIIFDLAGNGTVQYLFPGRGEESIIPKDRWTLAFQVIPPFGLDQVVAISSNKRLSELESALMRIDRTSAAGSAPQIIQKFMEANPDLRIGLATIATAP